MSNDQRNEDLTEFFSGTRLYGDDFSVDEIAEWFEAERDGFAKLPWDDAEASEAYHYHGLNWRHGFRKLPPGKLGAALGLGSAFGAEFLPIADRLSTITIVEPSKDLRSERIAGLRPEYVDPTADGSLPFADGSFDITLCLGVLHHIPNVSAVVSELARCSRPGGYLMLREPMVSMGDWRQPRYGLTSRERGIPRAIMLRVITDAGFVVDSAAPCLNPLSQRLDRVFPVFGPQSRFGALVDATVSRALMPNYRYHAETPWRKVRPTSLFVVARRLAN